MTDDQLSRRDPLLRLRALIDFDAEREIYIAQCLETGSVATADDPQTAQEMIVEVLDDEISFNLDHDNLRNLLGCPAPSSVWVNYMDADHAQNLALDPKPNRWPFRDLKVPLAVLRVRTAAKVTNRLAAIGANK